MYNSAVEGRKTVILASLVNTTHKFLSIYSICLMCVLQYSTDIETRPYSFVDNETLPLVIKKSFTSLSFF